QWPVLGLAAIVGVMSSVIPYGLEMVARRSIPASVFGILMSLEPAVAALAALVILHEQLSWSEVVAMACVIVASW
ncbi:EamA family transporter, partial [Sedimentibacter sp. B4]|uniref:EamA family transporter n=1 Tax=Sedimentibacter sp. B4 TaxID=304766 RepID=UPI0012F92DD5